MPNDFLFDFMLPLLRQFPFEVAILARQLITALGGQERPNLQQRPNEQCAATRAASSPDRPVIAIERAIERASPPFE